MKTIENIKNLIRHELAEAIGGGADGGIMDPTRGNPFVSHRQPAADPPKKEEDSEVDAVYDIALKARLATEELMRTFDELNSPLYDEVYEHAFKATSSLRHALNGLIELGAEPEEEDKVVAPPKNDQKYTAGGGDQFLGPTYTGGFDAGALEE